MFDTISEIQPDFSENPPESLGPYAAAYIAIAIKRPWRRGI
jgi:hypothetical protein